MTYPTKIDWAKISQPELVLQRFPSRRSVVYGTKGIVASSQPLATEAGLEILRRGGNAGAYPLPCISGSNEVLTLRCPCSSGRGGRDIRRAQRDRAKLLRHRRVRARPLLNAHPECAC